MRLLLFLLLLFLPLVAAGCFRDADPFELDRDPVQVHMVLAAGADSATLLLSRPASHPFSYRPIPGAEVRLLLPGQTVHLTERTDGDACALAGHTAIGNGSGCYSAALPVTIEAGAVYGLEVLLPGDGRVTGETRVPQQVVFTAPEPGTVYTVECPPIELTPECRSRFNEAPPFGLVPLTVMEIEWEAPVVAPRVDVLFRPARIVKDGATYPGDRCRVEPETLFEPAAAERGSVRWPVYTVSCAGPLDVIGWDTIYIHATVAVYDSSYATYLDAVRDRDAARIESVTAGLDGALGVFGAANSRNLELALVRVEQ